MEKSVFPVSPYRNLNLKNPVWEIRISKGQVFSSFDKRTCTGICSGIYMRCPILVPETDTEERLAAISKQILVLPKISD